MVSKDKKTTMALGGGGRRSLSDLKQPCDSDALKVYGSDGGHSGLLVHVVDAICNQAMEIGVVAEGTSAPLQMVPRIRKGEKRHGPADYTKTVIVEGFDCSAPGLRKTKRFVMEIGVIAEGRSAPLQMVPQIRTGEKRHGPADYTKTVIAEGFDCSSPGLRKTKTLVMETFGKCGEISRVNVPYDRSTQRGMGIAFVEFSSADGFNKALELDGIKLGDEHLEVRPSTKGPSHSGAYAGGDNGPDGCFGDSCRGGRGTPVKPRTVTFGTGKKTTFDD